MTVLVTGAAGFIGDHVIFAIAACRAQVNGENDTALCRVLKQERLVHTLSIKG